MKSYQMSLAAAGGYALGRAIAAARPDADNQIVNIVSVRLAPEP
jgi:hypothetical protein